MARLQSKASRLAIYQRNMAAMRLYRETHRCKDCKGSFPHYVMEFATPQKGEISISRLAGSRCALEELNAAMAQTDLLCANCKRIREFKHT